MQKSFRKHGAKKGDMFNDQSIDLTSDKWTTYPEELLM